MKTPTSHARSKTRARGVRTALVAQDYLSNVDCDCDCSERVDLARDTRRVALIGTSLRQRLARLASELYVMSSKISTLMLLRLDSLRIFSPAEQW